MIAKVAFGSEELALHLPDTAAVDRYRHQAGQSVPGFSRFLESIYTSEEKLFPLRTADLFVVNDAYRPTPTAGVLDWLEKGGFLPDKPRFLIATGTHQRPTPEQLKSIVGTKRLETAGAVLIHDCRDREQLVGIGRDPEGHEVYINRHFAGAQKIVVIGSVEPHYFAGFTGGRKSLIPGLCDFETTVRNHQHAVNPDSRAMRLDGNPVEEHLRTLMRLLPQKDIFSIQLVAISPEAIAAVYCGKLADSFAAAVEDARKVFGFHITGRYDLILAEVRPPLDSNLYQLQKALENCQEAVRDGGTIILFSPCHEGIGSANFYNLADHWFPGRGRPYTGTGSFGIHKIQRVYEISQRIKVLLYSKLAAGISDKVFFNGIDDPQAVIDNLSPNSKMAIVHDAGNIVLIAPERPDSSY